LFSLHEDSLPAACLTLLAFMRVYLFISFLLILLAFGCKPQKTKKEVPQPVQTDEVVERLQESIRKLPDSTRLYDSLINTLERRGLYSEAAIWCNELLGRGADSNYYYWYVKGDLFRKGKMYDSAIHAYEAYLNKFPDDEEILMNLGYTYAEAGNKNTLQLANVLTRRFPTQEMRSEAAFMKGVYYNTIKSYHEARRWLDTCLQLNYNYYEAYMEKGYSYFDEKKYKEALTSFTTLTNLNGNYAEAWYWMGKSEEALGQNKEAIDNYIQAYALDNSIVEAREAVERLQKAK
jgi:tetratricopeptide (TPR) repeat protein